MSSIAESKVEAKAAEPEATGWWRDPLHPPYDGNIHESTLR